MEELICRWSDGKTLPENYVFPPGKRPGNQAVPTSKTIPVIDLGKSATQDRSKIVQQIFEAAQEFGFFQVVNHGVPLRLMDDARGVFEEFFQLLVEEKSRFCSNKKCKLFTSNVDYDKEAVHHWRDVLSHSCTPLEDCMQYWPQRPSKYREVVGEYVINVRELGSKILELIGEGLRLEPGYFGQEVCLAPLLVVNRYPPCPDPSLTLGSLDHIDPNLITILLQGNVPGLQVLKDGKWIGVEPIRDAFVVNMGHSLEIVSNGKLKGVEHRAVTNATEARLSAAFFLEPTWNCHIEPAKSVLSNDNPPIYKSVLYKELLKSFKAAYTGETESVSQHWKLI